jgi:hypothetical protein
MILGNCGVFPGRFLTNTTRKIDRYMVMITVQDFGNFGWKFFSASLYSSMSCSAAVASPAV